MSRHHQAINRWRWAEVARYARARANHRCELGLIGVCTGTATQADHIVPLSQGGAPYDPANVRAVCRACNNARNRTTPAVDTTWTW